MTAQILCSAMDDDIRTERQRTLQIRREESVVYYSELAVLFGDLGNGFNISNSKKRVSRSLDIYGLYVIVDSGLNSFKI